MEKSAATSFRLTPEARELLSRLSALMGLTQTGVLEHLIREQAKREKLIRKPPAFAEAVA